MTAISRQKLKDYWALKSAVRSLIERRPHTDAIATLVELASHTFHEMFLDAPTADAQRRLARSCHMLLDIKVMRYDIFEDEIARLGYEIIDEEEDDDED